MYFQPLALCSGSRCQEINILGDSIKVPIQTIAVINLLTELELKYGEPTQPFLVAPFWPGAYAIFNKKSPIYGIYPSYTRSAKIQLQEINRLSSAQISFSIISNYALDGKDSLRFKNTHQVLYRYISDNFKRIEMQHSEGREIYISTKPSN